MLMIRGASLAGMEPAEMRCLNWLMSRGVGVGGSRIGGGRWTVEGEVLTVAVCGSDGTPLLDTAGLARVGVTCEDWLLGCIFARPSGQPAMFGAGSVGFSTIGVVLNRLSANVLVELVVCFLADIGFLPLLIVLSSSSDEISTTIWADITGWESEAG